MAQANIEQVAALDRHIERHLAMRKVRDFLMSENGLKRYPANYQAHTIFKIILEG